MQFVEKNTEELMVNTMLRRQSTHTRAKSQDSPTKRTVSPKTESHLLGFEFNILACKDKNQNEVYQSSLCDQETMASYHLSK